DVRQVSLPRLPRATRIRIEEAAANGELPDWYFGDRVAPVVPLCDRRDRQRGVEIEPADEPAVRFRQRLFDLPTQAEVQRQVALHPPVVLRVEREDAALFRVCGRAAHRPARGQTQEERREILSERRCRGVVQRSTR